MTDTDLDRVAKAEKAFKLFIVLACFVEGGFLLTYFLLMDFSDRLHWLILVAAGLVYITLVTALGALGSYVNIAEQRILKAIGEP